jgi:cytochrome c oxidase cbb3-type subunit III
MSVTERDPVLGYATTGHDWNGIKELNTPIPRVVLWFIAITHLYAVIGRVLLPTWPLGRTVTPGLLDQDPRAALQEDIAAATATRADWTEAFAA